MPPPSNPKLIPLYESAKRLAIAKRRMEQAEKEAKALDVLCEAYRQWRALEKDYLQPKGKK